MRHVLSLALATACAACGSSPAPEASTPSPAEAENPSFGSSWKRCRGGVPAELGAALEERARATTSCYEEALAENPELDSSVTVHLTIELDGSVSDAADHLKDHEHGSPALLACLRGRLSEQDFQSTPPERDCVWVAVSGERLDQKAEILLLSIVY